MAKAEVSPVQAGAKAVLKAVASLHPDEALEVLEPLAVEERPGIRRRVLLAARIALMRKALAAPARVVVAPVVEVVPEVEAPPPPPEPKPLPKGRIMSINLDDLSSMLMASPAEVEGVGDPPKAVAEETPADFAPLDWAEVAGTVGDSAVDPRIEDVPETDDPAPAPEGKASRGKKRGAVVAMKDKAASGGAAVDAGALFAAMEDDGPEVPKGKPAMVDPAAAFAAMEEAEVVEIAPPASVDVMDAGALFAAMEDDAPEVPKGKPAMVDATAAFAAMEAAEEEGARAVAPAPGKPKALAVDLSAQFAALDDET